MDYVNTTWEEQRNVAVWFPEIISCKGVEIRRVRVKKIIAYLLVLALFLPVGLTGNNSKEAKAQSSGDWSYTVLEDGTVSITGYSGSETELTIPGVIDGKKVTEIGSSVFVCIVLTSITIPDSVTSIGDGAFNCCSGLTSVTIPDSVTSIGGYAFYFCFDLASITIPNSVTSIGKHAFYGCSGLNQIIVSSDNKNYDSRKNCNAIIETETNTLITGCKNSSIPDSVTSIGENAFDGCIGLTSITIPDSVTSIGYAAFYCCNKLKKITIKSSNLKSVGKDAIAGVKKNAVIKVPKGKAKAYKKLFTKKTGYEKTMIIK